MKSLLQYIIGAIVGSVTMAGLLVLEKFPIWWVLLIFFAIAVPVYYLVFWYINKIIGWKKNVLYAAYMTLLCGAALITVVDALQVRNLLIFFVSGIIGLLYGWGIAQKRGAFYSSKTYRRFKMMLFVFNAYALSTFLYALSSFFVTSPFFLFAVVAGGVMYALFAMHIWRMYFDVERQSLVVWGWLLGVACFQLMWVIHMLPFAYGVLGLLSTWIWYIMQLFIRFHLGERGILWRKQAIFLSTNAVLFAIILTYFVRWV